MNINIIQEIKPYIKDINAYIVGGYVRDFLLKKESFDVDIVIKVNNIKDFVQNIAKKIEAHYVPLHENFGIYRLVSKDKKICFDFALMEGDTIEEDLSRRDFSINAICYDIKNDKIIDIFDGQNDLKNKKIKLISEKNIVDDPLRILRAFRFSSILGFDIDIDTLNIIKKNYKLINKPAKERLIYELMKMFSGKNVDEILLKMDECGILCEIFPYYNEIKKVTPNSHHHLDLIHHLIESVKQLEIEFEKQNDEIKSYLLSDFGSSNKFAYLKLATFLHDYGKPSTWTIEDNTGRHRFIGHDNVGAEMIKPVLKDLKFSNKQIEYISRMIKYHIYPSQLATHDITDKAKFRFYNKLKDEVIDIIMLAHADRESTLGEAITKEMLDKNRSSLDELLSGYFIERNRLKELPQLLNGNEIMKILNIKQSKKLGEIIKELKKAQVEKVINTKNEAIAFVKNISL